ncbi:MAG: hypothetical protein SF097_04275 [Acidobacteriota bacterium]|nr:hypothetical protein [Acidobacteriota bacterium]
MLNSTIIKRASFIVLAVMTLAILPALSVRSAEHLKAFAFAVDLAVEHIEVTQATQAPDNTIPLVAQRSTTVRAWIGVRGSNEPVTGVTGRLHVFVDGNEITPAAGVAPINAPFTAPLSPQRANENDTLNFELPAPTGIAASGNVRFRVEVAAAPGETNTVNNVAEVTLTVVDRLSPLIYFTRINYTPNGRGLPDPTFVQPGTGDAFFRGIFPVNDGDPNLYQTARFPTFNYTKDSNGNGILDGSDQLDLLAVLATCRQLIVNKNQGAGNRLILYGWLSGSVPNNGFTTGGSRVAAGNTEPIRGQRTLAHEFGHIFGLPHSLNAQGQEIALNIDEAGWDTGARLAGNPTDNNIAGRVRPTTLFDVMSAGRLSNEAWVNTPTYNFLLNSPILLPGQTDNPFSQRVAVIQGIFDPAGERLISLRPVFRYPWPSQPSQFVGTGRYAVEVTDNAGSVTRVMFNPKFFIDADKQQNAFQPDVEEVGFFEVMVPVHPDREISSVRITDSAAQRVFGSVNRSAPPQIRILAPQPGTALGANPEIVWEATDPDTPQDQLVYQIAYSFDAGQTFVPVGVDIKADRASFDSTAVQLSQGRGLIRVFVSDGLNTAFADVADLTVNTAACNGAICFRSSEYFLLNLNRLPGGSVLIGGVNYNAPVSTANVQAIKLALQGGTAPLQRLNQEFVAAQLNLALAGGQSSPKVYGGLRSPLGCSGISFAPTTLSNRVSLSPDSALNDLFEQARVAIRNQQTTDMLALANVFALLNGDDPMGRCNR